MKIPQSSIGSRAAPIPEGAVTGFATASSLINKARSIDGSEPPCGSEAPFKKRKVGKENKAVFKKPRKILEDDPPEDAPKVGHDTPPLQPKEPESLERTPAKKTRKKKSKDEQPMQAKIKKAGVTKPGVKDDTAKRKSSAPGEKKKEGTAGAKATKPAKKKLMLTPGEVLDLQLREAVKRRERWTPTKDTEQDLTGTEATPRPNFGSLIDDYGLAQQTDKTAIDTEATRMVVSESLVKRKKIELVSGISCQPTTTERPKQEKAPKKKPRTVTEKATAPFLPEEASSTSLLDYFAPPANSESTADETSKRRRTLPIKKTARTKAAPILLSPKTAMKCANDQEVIFGTSSQLAREESPTFLKDLQHALKESEPMELGFPLRNPDGTTRCLPGTTDVLPGLEKMSSSLALAPSRSLWSVAARGFDGYLLEAEVVDLSNTPKPGKQQQDVETPRPQKPREEASDQWNEVDDFSSPQKSTAPEHVREPGASSVEVDVALPRSIAEGTLKDRPRSKSPKKKEIASNARSDGMPNYKGFTDLQLSKEVKAYGFKTVKKREAMITLLEKCWDSKHSAALRELPPNVPLPPQTSLEPSKAENPIKKGRPAKGSAPKDSKDLAVDIPPKKSPGRPRKPLPKANEDDITSPPTKKPRGRPRKDPKATPSPKRKPKAKPSTTASVPDPQTREEISDSAPPTPTPPKRLNPKPTPQLPLSPTPTNPPLPLPPHQHPAPSSSILPQITKAILTQPATHDPANLTWHEKILLYDPLVLEELTIWLNTQGLAAVDEDGEVEVGMVREWCDSKGVCCLWRENLRGGERGR